MLNTVYQRIVANVVLMFILFIPFYGQEEGEEPPRFPRYQLFHMYLEYGSGEFSNPYGERLFEQIDVKMTYNQNLPNAEWLSLGFIAQVTWDQLTAKTIREGINEISALPSSATLSATIGFLNNIITIGAGTDATIAPTIYYNRVLSNTPGLYSHDVTFLFVPTFYLPGNQYDNNGELKKAWFDQLEIRFAYRMKFNQYVGLRPEFLFNFTGTDLIAGKNLQSAFMFRFNPRLQFYWDQFSMFIEPRFFWVGNKNFYPVLNSDDGFFWEIKVGFDITHFILK